VSFTLVGKCTSLELAVVCFAAVETQSDKTNPPEHHSSTEYPSRNKELNL
jgi:hypothetical protein